MEISSVKWPGLRLKGVPPIMSVRGVKEMTIRTCSGISGDGQCDLGSLWVPCQSDQETCSVVFFSV